MALKLVMEPIFESGFYPSSYAYRPGRRCQDAIAEIYLFTIHSLRVDRGNGHRGMLRSASTLPHRR